MKVLIDTNILIYRESPRSTRRDIGTLFYWINTQNFVSCVHELTLEEIRNFAIDEEVDLLIEKARTYKLVSGESTLSPELRRIAHNDKTRNDEIDTTFLNETVLGRFDLLVTEDRGIHRKAEMIGKENLVFTIEEFITFSQVENPNLVDYSVLSIKKENFVNINLSDPFFDSFKEDYAEFEKWFIKKSDETAYVCEINCAIKAFLYVKVEDELEVYDSISPPMPARRRLKIGTFKVDAFGLKLGERFLKIAIDNAIQFEVDEVYVTLFEHRDGQKRLKQLVEDWGFSTQGTKVTSNGSETVLARPMRSDPRLPPVLRYPYVSASNPACITPIYPSYHTELFPDSILTTESPANFQELVSHRNSIRKVYVSRAITREVSPGDTIFFYRTGGHYKGVVSTIGIVERILTDFKDFDQFYLTARKRSVYSKIELFNLWNYDLRNRPYLVQFLYCVSYRTPKPNLAQLREDEVLNFSPRGFHRISDEAVKTLLKYPELDENFVGY